jgi:hypothetical protein
VWGARLPFSRRAALTNALRDPAGIDPEPEYLSFQGAEISSATLPSDVLDRLAAVGRRPIWEVKIPLKRLAPDAERAVAVDFVLNAPAGGAKRRSAPAPAPKPAENGDAEAGRGQGRRKGQAKAEPSRAEESVWDALSYRLSVRLAPDPATLP